MLYKPDLELSNGYLNQNKKNDRIADVNRLQKRYQNFDPPTDEEPALPVEGQITSDTTVPTTEVTTRADGGVQMIVGYAITLYCPRKSCPNHVTGWLYGGRLNRQFTSCSKCHSSVRIPSNKTKKTGGKA